MELFVFVGCGLYNIIANYRAGIDIWGSQTADKTIIVLDTLGTAVFSAALLAVLSGNTDVAGLLVYFVVFALCTAAFRLLMTSLNRKKQNAIDRALEDDEPDE